MLFFFLTLIVLLYKILKGKVVRSVRRAKWDSESIDGN